MTFSICVCYRWIPEREGMITACLENLRRWDHEIRIGGALQDGRWNRAAALNEAIRASGGQWIVAMDADMLLPPDFFERLWPFLWPSNMLLFDFFEACAQRFPEATGGVTAFWRELYEAAGGYNEAYEGYGYEDLDFRDRMVARGAQIVNTHIPVEHIPHPQVEGIHEDLRRNREVYEGVSGV